MSVKLRLMRFGKTHRPFYRVCAIDTRAPRDGAYIESIGHYDPLIEDFQKGVTIDKERAAYWLSVGAQPSETVRSFLQKSHVAGIIRTKKTKKRRPSKNKNKKPTTRELQRKAAKKKAIEAANAKAGEKAEE